MSEVYKYGVSGVIEASKITAPAQAAEVVVYVGAAPVNLVRGWADAGVVNRPLLVANLTQARKKAGYSPDFASFPLSEAVSAHFKNDVNAVGPIVLINVLDPAVHKKTSPTAQSVSIANGKGSIVSDKIVLDTLVLDGLVEGVDYDLSYDWSAGAAVIKAHGSATLPASVDAEFDEVDPVAVTDFDVIGDATDDGVYTGIHAVADVYNAVGSVPAVLLAPGRSHVKAVYDALVANCIGIGGHWCADVYADIPVSAATDSIDEAIAWKAANGYNSEHSKVFWPLAKKAGVTYHLSVIGAVSRLYTDGERGGVPCESPANKLVDIDGIYTGAANGPEAYNKPVANRLTEEGITTAICFGGAWRLWGDHTAAYSFNFEHTLDPRAIFDVNMSMMKYLINGFQIRHTHEIDTPVDRNRIDSILNVEQEQLDTLKASGALIGDPKVSFIDDENDVSDIMAGRFHFDIVETNAPPLKSAEVGVAYTDAGFSALFA